MRILVSALLLMAASPLAAGRIFVSSETAGTVTVIDSTTYRIVKTITTGFRPRGIQVSPDQKLVYVAVSDLSANTTGSGDAIIAINADTGRVIQRYPGGTDPEQFAVYGGRLYAANKDAGTATIVDLKSRRILATLVVGIEPEGVAVSPDGRWVYVTAETSNTVSVIDNMCPPKSAGQCQSSMWRGTPSSA